MDSAARSLLSPYWVLYSFQPESIRLPGFEIELLIAYLLKV
jgi:hypothetical protein